MSSRRRGVNARTTATQTARDKGRQVNQPRRSIRLTGGQLALAAIAAFALALRLPGVTSGLPDFFDEALPLRHALEMWEGNGASIDWNPHLFHYPSLTFYLHLLVQQLVYLVGQATGAFSGRADFIVGFFTDPTLSVIAGRLMHALFDVATVVALGLAGERMLPGAGLVAAALFACAPSTVLTARAVSTDTVMTAFAAIAFERMLAWHAAGGRSRLIIAGVAIGLAAGAKYPGFAMLAPLAWLAVSRERTRGAGAWVLAAAVAAGTFLVTTPYALLDSAAFQRDVAFVGRMTSAGHLGNFDRAGLGYHARNLLRDLGPLGMAALLASPIVAWRRRDRTPAVVAAWIALLAYGVPIAIARVEAERYVLPVVAFGALLAGTSAAALWSVTPAPRRRLALAAGVGLLLGPVLVAGAAAAWRRGSTQNVAREWMERTLPQDALIVRELYGPSVLPRAEYLRILTSPVFEAARPDVQQRYKQRRWMPVIDLPIATVGRLVNPVRRADGTVERVTVMDQGADFNRVFYDARLLAGVDIVVTSSAVRGRFEASPERFPVEAQFYALLDSTAELAVRFDPHGSVDGPNIRVYRLGDRARAAIADLGPLEPLWWIDAVPSDYRRLADSLLAKPHVETPRLASGDLAPWARSMEPTFLDRIAPFSVAAAIEHDEHQHWALAGVFAASILEVSPTNVGAALSLGRAAREGKDWSLATPAMERAVSALPPERVPLELRLALAEALWRGGQRPGAEEQLQAVARAGAGPAQAAEATRRRLSAEMP